MGMASLLPFLRFRNSSLRYCGEGARLADRIAERHDRSLRVTESSCHAASLFDLRITVSEVSPNGFAEMVAESLLLPSAISVYIRAI
jgi:hypothetical protein